MAPSRRPHTVPPTSTPRGSRGYLGDKPLLELFLRALDSGFEGTLGLQDPSGACHLIWFVEGLPACVHTRPEVAPIGGLLRELGVPDDVTREVRMTSGSRYDMVVARWLVSRELVTPCVYDEALERQLMRRIRSLLELDGWTRYRVYPGSRLVPAEYDSRAIYCGTEEVLSFVGPVVRTGYGRLPIRACLRELGNTELRLHPEAPLDLLGLDRPQRAVVDVLTAQPMTLSELIEEVPDEALVRSTVYALALTRAIDVPGESRPPIGARKRRSSGVRARVSRSLAG